MALLMSFYSSNVKIELVITRGQINWVGSINSGLDLKNFRKRLAIIQADPYQNPPPDEKLVGDLSGAYSRRINIQHRLV